MIYTIEKANLISELLRKFTSGYAHHVAGQFSNIDFWMHEVQESIKIIDEYNKRFNKIRDAQKEWVESHGTVVYDYCPHCGGKCQLSNGTPSPPTRTSANDLKESRKELVDAAYYFLLRCYRMKLLDKKQLEIKCNQIGTSIELSDIE